MNPKRKLPRWLHLLAGTWRQPRSNRRPRSRHSLTLEPLEDRLAPAVVSWDGGLSGTGTNWHDKVNWAGDVLPGSSDDVEIGAAFAGVTITSGSDFTINSLTSAASLQITGGTFTVGAASVINNGLILSGGTLAGSGDVTVTGQLAWTGGEMTGTGHTRVAGTMAVSGGNLLYFHGGRTLDNAGTVAWA